MSIKGYHDRLNGFADEMIRYANEIKQYISNYSNELLQDRSTYLSWLPKEIFEQILSMCEIDMNHYVKINNMSQCLSLIKTHPINLDMNQHTYYRIYSNPHKIHFISTHKNLVDIMFDRLSSKCYPGFLDIDQVEYNDIAIFFTDSILRSGIYMSDELKKDLYYYLLDYTIDDKVLDKYFKP